MSFSWFDERDISRVVTITRYIAFA